MTAVSRSEVSTRQRSAEWPDRAGQTPWRNRIVGHAEVAPTELVPNPANWRTHPPEQQRALAGALGEVGWVAQILVNRTTGHIVDGHLRVELALARDEATVPVTYVELTEEEERLVLASLDPLAAMAEAEKDALAALLAGLSSEDAALAQMLADLADRNGIRIAGLSDPDEVPPLPDEAAVWVKPGELYRLGEHRLLCGDATKPQDVDRLLAGAEPTLLATDPPYGVSYDASWRDGVYNGPHKRVRGWGVNQGAERPYMMRDGTDGKPAEDDATASPARRHGRGPGHRATKISGDVRADWSEAFALVPSLQVGYIWYASAHTLAVLNVNRPGNRGDSRNWNQAACASSSWR
jgi:hypothetical protein